MSTTAGSPSKGTKSGVKSPDSKGKAKAKTINKPMEEEEDDDSEDEDEALEGEDEDEDEDEEEEEEGMEEIDPSAIVTGGRRTRGLKVDYTSKEALEKAGLTGNEKDEDDEDDDAMKE